MAEATANFTRAVRAHSTCQLAELRCGREVSSLVNQLEACHYVAGEDLPSTVVAWILVALLLLCSFARMAYLWARGEESTFPLDR